MHRCSLLNYGLGQFIEISKPNLHLSLYRGFLEVRKKTEFLSRVPLDDVLGVIITGYGCTHSSNILSVLAEKGIPVSICGANFLPKALVLPVEGNCRQSLRIRGQCEVAKPLKKRLWKQVVEWKLRHQAEVLKHCEMPYQWLISMSQLVRSGDPENLEAQGARRYWINLFSKSFRRDQGGNGTNAMLNYAYAIIRSCVARGVVTAGLHPSIGIHHKNIYNSMCLVDDLMEPFRPIADYIVKQLHSQGYQEIDAEVKQILASIASVDVVIDSKINPLFQIIIKLATSLAMVLSGEKKQWNFSFKINWDNFNVDSLHYNRESFSA